MINAEAARFNPKLWMFWYVSYGLKLQLQQSSLVLYESFCTISFYVFACWTWSLDCTELG